MADEIASRPEGVETRRRYIGQAVMSLKPGTTSSMSVSLPLSEVPQAIDFADWVGQLVREHRNLLANVARQGGLTSDEALDAVQEAFATFIENPEWRTLRDPAAARALLASLVKNKARNARRLHSRKDLGMEALTGESEVDRAWRELDELLIEAQEHLRLTGCIATLKEIQRTVVTSRFFEGASGQEAARVLGLTPGNVAVILHRARESLRGCLASSRDAFHLTAPISRARSRA